MDPTPTVALPLSLSECELVHTGTERALLLRSTDAWAIEQRSEPAVEQAVAAALKSASAVLWMTVAQTPEVRATGQDGSAGRSDGQQAKPYCWPGEVSLEVPPLMAL